MGRARYSPPPPPPSHPSFSGAYHDVASVLGHRAWGERVAILASAQASSGLGVTVGAGRCLRRGEALHTAYLCPLSRSCAHKLRAKLSDVVVGLRLETSVSLKHHLPGFLDFGLLVLFVKEVRERLLDALLGLAT